MIDFFKYAINSLRKNKVYTLINVVGLTLGLSIAFALTTSIINFVNLDQFHRNKGSVYKLAHTDDSTTTKYYDASSALLAPTIKAALPGVIDYCQYLWANDMIMGTPENHVKENGFYVDEGWFRMLSFPLVYGNPNEVLSDLSNIVLSQKLSKKLFGDANPVGKSIKLFYSESDQPDVFKVSGVFENMPVSTTLNFEFAIPFAWYSSRNSWLQRWDNIGVRSYIQIAPNTDIKALSRSITKLVRSKDPEMRDTQVFGLVPLSRSNGVIYKLSGEPSFGYYIIIAMAIVGLSILAISVINYINLSIATSLKRAKEIGVKKIHGAGRRDLVIQFFMESFIVVSSAGIMASFLQTYILSIFLPEQISPSNFIQPSFIIAYISLLIITMLVTTWYPALYMSKFSPSVIQKKGVDGSYKLSFSRRFLVILQFIAAIILIATSIVLSRQVDYLLNQSLGMDRYSTVLFTKNKPLEQHKDAFIQELTRKPGVESVTHVSQLPFGVGSSFSDEEISFQGKDPLVKDWYSDLYAGDNFATTMKIKLLKGSDFSAGKKNQLLVNRAAVELMKMDNPVGSAVTIWSRNMEIVGVVDNFKFQMMDNPDKPLFIMYEQNLSERILVRLKEGEQEVGIKSLKEAFNQFSPEFILDYCFLDQEFNQWFRQLNSMGRIMSVVGFLAIIIACLGLLGLTVHTSERRVKELGIRKINGASVFDLIKLLSSQMAGSILIAAAVAYPLAFMINKMILQSFPSRIPLSIIHFIWSFLILLVITTLIVGWQIVWVVRRNPVEALRYE